MTIRSAFFAAQGWYPANAEMCKLALEQYFAQAADDKQGADYSCVVPHAGWRFSGAIAARGFAALDRGFRRRHQGQLPDLVILFAGHTSPGEVPRLLCSGAFATPLGELVVDAELAERFCQKFLCRREDVEPARPDNAIELQLPFIKQLWPEAQVLVTTVPADLNAALMGQWLAQQTVERAAVAIGSTDLTHYGAPYGFMPQGVGVMAHQWSKDVNDAAFLQALIRGDDDALLRSARLDHAACCPGAALAAMHFARSRGVESGQVFAHQTSYEVGGGRPDMWVGYAAIGF